MGKSIVDFLTAKDLKVIAVTRLEEQAKQLNRKWQKGLVSKQKYGVITADKADEMAGQFLARSSIEAVAGADIIIESVYEDVEIKREVFSQIGKYMGKNAIVASNSSSILPLELTDKSFDVSRLVGLHFFFPVSVSNLVEFITHDDLDKGVYTRIDDFITRHEIIKVEQGLNNAFLLNMLSMAMGGEAFRGAVKFGFTRANELSKSEIFPLGIFSLFDHVGIPVILEATKRYADHDPLKNKKSYESLLAFMKVMMGSKNPDMVFSDIKYPRELANWDGEVLPLYDNEDKFKQRLNYLHINTCLFAVETGLIDKNIIDKAIMAIMGTDKGPIQLANEIGPRKIRLALEAFYHEREAPYYRPTSLLGY